MKQKFEIQPHVGPLPIRFGMSEEDVMKLFGSPHVKSVNTLNEPDWSYDDFSVRFGSGREGVVEVGFYPSAELRLFGLDLFNEPNAFEQVISNRDDVFEDVGFIIIPSLGLTFTGFHDEHEEDKAVTVFVDGRWDDRKGELVPWKHAQSRIDGGASN